MKAKLFIIVAAFMLVLVGCNTNNQEDRTGPRTDKTGFEQLNRNETNRMNVSDRDGTRLNTRNMQDNTNRAGDMNRNNDRNDGRHHDRYNVSKKAANKIVKDVKEIDRAHVLTTNNNAYVAVVFDKDHNTDKNDNRNNDNDSRKNITHNDNVNNNNRNNNNIRDINKNNRMDRENNDRFGDRDDNISDDMKERIADTVKSVDNNIDNVYVSTNPDFVDLVNGYVDDVNNGQPVRGFFDEMGNMIQRVFPQNR